MMPPPPGTGTRRVSVVLNAVSASSVTSVTGGIGTPSAA